MRNESMTPWASRALAMLGATSMMFMVRADSPAKDTMHNQHGKLVMEGEQKYLLLKRPRELASGA